VLKIRDFSRNAGNRVAATAVALWLVYVVGVHPFIYDAGERMRILATHWYDKPFLLFVAFGQCVAAAVGLFPRDAGAVQVISGLLALVVCVRLACWVKGPRRD
jgi:hypothetical protein